MKIIDRTRIALPLLAAVALAAGAAYPAQVRAQAADDPEAPVPAAGVGANTAAHPQEDTLLGAPQPYGADAQGISNAAQQAALINGERVDAATPTDHVLENQAAPGKARPQSFVAPGTAVLPDDPLVKDTDAKQIRTPDAAAQNVYRATQGPQGPKAGMRAGGVDPYATTGHPVYTSPW
jgi:hypothetical protein